MKNLIVLSLLGFVVAYFISGNTLTSFDVNKILDQFYVSKSRMLGMVGDFHASKEENEKAIQYFDDAKIAVNNIKDNTKRIKEFLNIIEKKAETNEIVSKGSEEDIIKIIKEIKNIPEDKIEEKQDIFSEIVVILPKIDLSPEKLSSEIENPEDQSIFLFNTALLYLKENQQDLATDVISKITDENYKKIAVMILLDKFFDKSSTEELLQQFKGSVIEDFIYLNNLRKLLNSEEIEKAQNFVDSFENKSLQKMGWMEIFNFQIKKGNIDSAVDILQTKIE
jgi:predicted negative regulator of RcsB-dependent stress response